MNMNVAGMHASWRLFLAFSTCLASPVLANSGGDQPMDVVIVNCDGNAACSDACKYSGSFFGLKCLTGADRGTTPVVQGGSRSAGNQDMTGR